MLPASYRSSCRLTGCGGRNTSHAKHRVPSAADGAETAMSPLTADTKADVDEIVETILYLYTESRRLTKGMASQYGLTGPQLTVVKLLESIGDMSLSSLSERIRAQNSTVTG